MGLVATSSPPAPVGLHLMFVKGRPTRTLMTRIRGTPAMAAGVADHVWTCEAITALLDHVSPTSRARGMIRPVDQSRMSGSYSRASAVRLLVNPTVGLVLSILVINLAALVAYAVAGEALGHDILAIVGLCDATVGVIVLLRAVGEGMRQAHPRHSLGASVVAPALVTLLFVIWPFPIHEAARLVAPADGQAIGEAFITIYAALWAIIASVAIASRLRFEQRRSN